MEYEIATCRGSELYGRREKAKGHAADALSRLQRAPTARAVVQPFALLQEAVCALRSCEFISE
jgi:hypothetical protein